MEEIKKHEPGTFCWVDLATIGAEDAKKFYTELFAWEAIDTPAGEAGVYTMLNLDGKPVAALYEMSEEQKGQNMPPYWMSYVAVESAEAVMSKVAELGGQVIMNAFDVMEYGRMGLFQGPSGAMLAIWEPKQHIGASFKNIPGALCWNELATHDREKAEPFYTQLFGWTAKTDDMGNNMFYTAFLIGETSVGGMYNMPPNMSEIPAHWLPYFNVADCDATVEKAQSLGGQVVMPATDVANVGRFAVLRDPQGGVFAVIKM